MTRILRRIPWLFPILAGIALSLPPVSEGAEIQLKKPAGSAARRILTLQESVDLALRNNFEIREAEAETDIFRAKQAQAEAARWPQVEILGIVGPSPRARGNQVFSPDDFDHENPIGIFQSIKLNAVQPIFTYGLINGLIDAARNGVRVKLAGEQVKRSEIALKVNEYYYGVVAAREVVGVLSETRDTLLDARRKLLKLIAEEKEEEINLHKLDAFAGELEKGLNEAQKNEALALGALKFATVLPRETRIDVADKHIEPNRTPVESLPAYQSISLKTRPELEQLKAGLKARKALVRVEQSRQWPQIFVAIIGSVANADNRTAIKNPFVFDHFNHEFITAVAGFKWAINFGITKGRIAQARAEVQKLEYKQQRAVRGIPVQVKKAFVELMTARKNIIATEKAYRAAKKWMIAAVANLDLGVGSAKDVFDALGQFVKMRVANLQAIYNHNISFARLERAAGTLVPRSAGAEKEIPKR